MTHLLFIDLEATCDSNNRLPKDEREIIEIGAAVIKLDNLSVIDSYQGFVRPVAHSTLTTFCKELTKISQDTVNSAPAFREVNELFGSWLQGIGDFSAWGSWGGFDYWQFIRECKRNDTQNYLEDIPYFNLKNEFATANGIRRRGMKNTFKYLNSLHEMEGQHHSGLADALNMAKLLNLSPEFGLHMQRACIKSD